MPKATAEGVTGAIDGKLYMLPGHCSGIYRPETQSCETEPTRQLAVPAFENGVWFNRTYSYTPATNRWKALAPIPPVEGARPIRPYFTAITQVKLDGKPRVLAVRGAGTEGERLSSWLYTP